jgi:hypothetical protein
MHIIKVEMQGNKVQGGREVWRAIYEDGTQWVSARNDTKLEMLLRWMTYLQSLDKGDTDENR